MSLTDAVNFAVWRQAMRALGGHFGGHFRKNREIYRKKKQFLILGSFESQRAPGRRQPRACRLDHYQDWGFHPLAFTTSLHATTAPLSEYA